VVSDRHDATIAETGRLLGRPVTFLRELPGGTHALTLLVEDGRSELVVRLFPQGDPAPRREQEVLSRVAPLGGIVPHLVAVSDDPGLPLIVMTRLPGAAPEPDLPLPVVATEMATALARIHRLPGDGLPVASCAPPDGDGPLTEAAGLDRVALASEPRMLAHSDFWCGNALWTDGQLTGVVDWSGAKSAPRGADLAWCRLDLVLMGSVEAADVFLAAYERSAGVRVERMAAWDLLAAARAERTVETWSPNYVGIGRVDLTPEALRERLTDWSRGLLGR